MKRRTLLASLAASTGAVGAAGCLQNPGSPGETTTMTDDTEPTTEEPQEWDPSGEPVATLSINDREGLSFPDNNQPHAVVLWNDVDRERELVVEWSDGRTDELESLDPVAVPADGHLQVDLQLPTSYEVLVSADGETLGSVSVGRERFDCNSSATRVGVG